MCLNCSESQFSDVTQHNFEEMKMQWVKKNKTLLLLTFSVTNGKKMKLLIFLKKKRSNNTILWISELNVHQKGRNESDSLSWQGDTSNPHWGTSAKAMWQYLRIRSEPDVNFRFTKTYNMAWYIRSSPHWLSRYQPLSLPKIRPGEVGSSHKNKKGSNSC